MKRMTLGQLRKLISEVVQDTLQENEEEGPGRPRENPESPISKLIDDDPNGAEGVADKLGVSVAHINKLSRGDATPSLKLAFKMSDETAGEIPVKSWKKSR